MLALVRCPPATVTEGRNKTARRNRIEAKASRYPLIETGEAPACMEVTQSYHRYPRMLSKGIGHRAALAVLQIYRCVLEEKQRWWCLRPWQAKRVQAREYSTPTQSRPTSTLIYIKVQ